jgi:hypothetical protein
MAARHCRAIFTANQIAIPLGLAEQCTNMVGALRLGPDSAEKIPRQ